MHRQGMSRGIKMLPGAASTTALPRGRNNAGNVLCWLVPVVLMGALKSMSAGADYGMARDAARIWNCRGWESWPAFKHGLNDGFHPW